MPKIFPEKTREEPTTDDAFKSFFLQNGSDEGSDDWIAKESGDGQLAVDVSETDNAFIIETALAGVEPEDLSVSVHRDMVTIKGTRQQPDVEERSYLTQECYWGNFSRSILLPSDVIAEKGTATLRRSILTLRLPKRAPSVPRNLRVHDEDADESDETE